MLHRKETETPRLRGDWTARPGHELAPTLARRPGVTAVLEGRAPVHFL
ncbi:hypothetical protein WME90_23970 [Sorangium sp. So ce375]